MIELIGQISVVILLIIIAILGHKKAQWRKWEILAIFLPYMLWGMCFAIPINKYPKFAPVEPWIITMALFLWAIARVIIGVSKKRFLSPKLLLLYLCIFAVLVFFWIPIFG